MEKVICIAVILLGLTAAQDIQIASPSHLAMEGGSVSISATVLVAADNIRSLYVAKASPDPDLFSYNPTTGEWDVTHSTDTTIVPEGKYEMTGQPDNSVITLTINGLDWNDIGEYTFSLGAATQSTASSFLIVIGPLSVTVSADVVTVGEVIYGQCTVQTGRTAHNGLPASPIIPEEHAIPIYAYIKDKRLYPVSNGSVELEEVGERYHQENYSITIEKEYHNELFSCYIEDNKDDESYSSSKRLQVEYEPEQIDIHPKPTDEAYEIETELNCTADSFPLPRSWWWRDLQNGGVSEGRHLVLNQAMVDHQQKWQCIGEWIGTNGEAAKNYTSPEWNFKVVPVGELPKKDNTVAIAVSVVVVVLVLLIIAVGVLVWYTKTKKSGSKNTNVASGQVNDDYKKDFNEEHIDTTPQQPPAKKGEHDNVGYVKSPDSAV